MWILPLRIVIFLIMKSSIHTYLLLLVLLSSLFMSDASVCDKQKKPCAFNIYVVNEIRINVIIVPIIVYI